MLQPPVVIVTGASRGLGAATARALAAQGANLVLNARSADALEALVAQLRAQGAHAVSVAGSLRDAATTDAIVEAALAQFGQIDGLVNNAGVLEPVAPFGVVDLAAVEENLAVNLLAPLRLTQRALPYLRATRGRVINISSGAAVRPLAGWAAYCAAKAALNHFTAVLALDEPVVTALALRPGIVDTAMQAVIRAQGADGMPADVHARFVRDYEEGRLLPPEKPAAAIAALALRAPAAWSGEFVAWDDPKVAALLAA